MHPLHIHILKKRTLPEWLFWGLLFLFSGICMLIYFQYVAPSITGKTEIRIGADSDHYWDAVEAAQADNGRSLISVTGNFLGPVTIGRILHTGFAVMCFNFVLLSISWKVVTSIPRVNKAIFGFLLLANVELLPSLTTLNKEILTLLASALTAKYLYSSNRPKILLVILLTVSTLSRWEQSAFLLLLLAIQHSPLKNRPWTTILLLVALITIGYPFAFQIFGVDPSIFDAILEGSNTIVKLNSIQNSFGFPLVVIPKIAMLMVGRLAQLQFYTANSGLASGFQDPQQEIFQPLGCFATVALFTYAAWTGRMKPTCPVPLLIVITLIATAATPFIQPRYLYGVYVLLCIEIARTRPNAERVFSILYAGRPAELS